MVCLDVRVTLFLIVFGDSDDDVAEDTNEDLDVGKATVVDDDVPSEEIAVADDEAEAVAGDEGAAAVSAHDLDKDKLKWDDHEGVMSDVVIL